MITTEEMKEKSIADLKQLVVDLSKELFQLRMQKASGVEVKTDQFAKLRQSRARLLTFITQKEKGGN